MNIGMTRLGTWLVVAAIGLLGLVAAVDAFRGGEEVRPPPTRRPTDRTTTAPQETDTAGPEEQLTEVAARDLAEAGIEGELVRHRHPAAGCEASCSRPSRRPPRRSPNGCRLSAHAREPARGRRRDRPRPGRHRRRVHRRRGRRASAWGEQWPVRGSCPPAWTPDGRLTVVAGGELREVGLGCLRQAGGTARVPLLRRADLRARARRAAVADGQPDDPRGRLARQRPRRRRRARRAPRTSTRSPSSAAASCSARRRSSTSRSPTCGRARAAATRRRS